MTTLRDIVAANIKAERVKQNLTQLELARKAKLTDVYISRIERNGKNITLDSLEQIAKALDISCSELLKGVEKKSVPGRDLKVAKSLRHAVKIIEAYIDGLEL